MVVVADVAEGVWPINFEDVRGVTEFQKVDTPAHIEIRHADNATLEAHSPVTGWLRIGLQDRGALADELIRLAGAIRRGEIIPGK